MGSPELFPPNWPGFGNSSLAGALTGILGHIGALARANIAKHRGHCQRIECSSLFQTVVLLEPREGLLRLRTDHTIERAVVKTRVSQL
jgi:hypothetical protein